MTTRDEYIDDAKKKLDELNAKLAKLEVRADEAKGELKRELASEINDIRESKAKVEGGLRDLRSAGESAWEDIKNSVELARESLSKSFKSAIRRFE